MTRANSKVTGCKMGRDEFDSRQGRVYIFTTTSKPGFKYNVFGVFITGGKEAGTLS